MSDRRPGSYTSENPRGDQDAWRSHLQSETHSSSRAIVDPNALAVPTLTLIWHPAADRIGEYVLLQQLARGQAVGLSRLEPLWTPLEGGEGRPLADPRLSRTPLSIAPDAGGLLLDATTTRTAVRLDGERLTTIVRIPDERLREGVLLALADRILLLLHHRRPAVTEPDDLGLVGSSDEIRQVRREISQVAPLDIAILITGESGTGKELVARAIQSTGRRRDKPFVSLNLAAVTPSLAGAELFGAAKGAYSGASHRREGFFARAHQGTLFLDEIGEAPLEIQSLLLRALETGEIQPVGAERAKTVDVRLLAATDIDLDRAVAEGRLSAPLLHRLSTFVIDIPPLRRRRADLGCLLLHFIRRELSTLGRPEKMDDRGPYAKPWISALLVERLALFDWPGNVRQLRNIVRQLVVTNRDSAVAELGPKLTHLLRSGPENEGETASDAETSARGAAVATSARRTSARAYRDPSTIDEGELIAALRRNRWQPKPCAEELRISRASLYNLIDRSSNVRKAADLTREEIERAFEESAGELEAMVEALQVSKQGLKIRLREIGLLL